MYTTVSNAVLQLLQVPGTTTICMYMYVLLLCMYKAKQGNKGAFTNTTTTMWYVYYHMWFGYYCPLLPCGMYTTPPETFTATATATATTTICM